MTDMPTGLARRKEIAELRTRIPALMDRELEAFDKGQHDVHATIVEELVLASARLHELLGKPFP